MGEGRKQLDRIEIDKAVSPYGGTYEFDANYLTNRDFSTIKKISGLRAAELDEALRAADTDLVLAFAVIALNRHGKRPDMEVLWEAEAGAIKLVLVPDEEEEEETPTTPGTSPGSSDDSVSDVTSLRTSGTASSEGLEKEETIQNGTGTPPSESDQVASDLETLET